MKWLSNLLSIFSISRSKKAEKSKRANYDLEVEKGRITGYVLFHRLYDRDSLHRYTAIIATTDPKTWVGELLEKYKERFNLCRSDKGLDSCRDLMRAFLKERLANAGLQLDLLHVEWIPGTP